MSEYFGNYNRPKEEIRIIQKFIKIFNQSRTQYKLKNYKTALSGFTSGLELISDIFDTYPKSVTLNLIIKSQFRLYKYTQCLNSISQLKQYMPSLIEQNREAFIKLNPKIYFYEFIVDFLCDELDESLLCVTEFISYLKLNKFLSLEEKVNSFWIFIKNFIKLGLNVKLRHFILFKQQYFAMTVEENVKKNGDDNINIKAEKKITKNFAVYYKQYMNLKLKKIIYINLDKKYYFYKYGEKDDKIINFLNRNIEPYILSGIKDNLFEKIQNYLLITKIDLKQKYNISIEQLVSEEKLRTKYFNSAFLNIVGSFNQIFSDYYTGNEVKIRPLKSSNSMALLLSKEGIKNLEQKLIQKMKIVKPNKRTRNIEKQNKYSTMPNFNLEFKVPPIGEKIKKTVKNPKLYFSNAKYKNLFNCSYRVSSVENYITTKLSIEDKNSLPLLENSKNAFNTLQPKLVITRINKSKIMELQKKLFYQKIIYKNINYFLISKFIEKYENDVNYINLSEEEKHKFKRISNTKAENNLIDLFFCKSVKKYNFCKLNGDINADNYHNSCFIFDNYMQIKNFCLFGLCESKGQFNSKITKTINFLFPTFLNYLIIEYILAKENKDFGELIIKLIKLEELSEKLKNTSLLSYISNKLKINYKYFLSLSFDLEKISNILYEALFFLIKDIMQKYKYQFDSSGINFSSIMILGNILYILNIGNSNALIGYKNSNSNNKSDYKPFSFDKNNKNIKKLILINNSLITEEESKKVNKDIVYKYKVTEKESLLIGKISNENNYNKKGIVFNQELIKKELNSDDKFIIIGSQGFWKHINNEEAISFIGNYYNSSSSPGEISQLMVDMAKERLLEEKKENNDLNNKKKKDLGKKNDDDDDSEFDGITCMIIFLDSNEII